MSFRFEEEDYRTIYLLDDYYCTNPFCDCKHVTLSFRDRDNEDNRISFLLHFNKTHSSLPDQPKMTRTQTDIIKRFTKTLPDEMLILFKQRYMEAKAYGEKNPGSYLVFEPGRYVNYLEMFPKMKNSLEFTLNKVKYFAEDSYDMDPRNDNRDVQLAFFKLEWDNDKQSRIFTYSYSFDEKTREETDAKLSPEHSALVIALNTCVPNLSNLLKEHYKESKAIGEDLLKQSPKTAIRHLDIHRNEPCPCGSGKKFKRCCGARENLN
ncbi:MAG: YecA family protein [Nitrospinales bacterium]